MSHSRPRRRTIRRARVHRRGAAGLLAVLAVAASGWVQLPASSSSTVVPRVPEAGGTTAGGLGEADGVVPDGTRVFDDGIRGVANLDPALLGALRRAATHAADEGVELLVASGWRSARYQQQLLDEAVIAYGSQEQAARWVAPPDRSAHVSGDAVDLGPPAAAAWLSRHGARYGLCQIYRNESWHFELRPGAPEHGCPPMYADPTHDPRLRPRGTLVTRGTRTP